MDTATINRHNIELLAGIGSSCGDIQQSLREHLATTKNPHYITQIEKDIVTLENLKLIAMAIRNDIEAGTIGASTELLLRIAANDFINKLAQIPEKKSVRMGVSRSLKEVHRAILRMTASASREG